MLRCLEIFEPPDGGVAEHVRLLAEGLQARDNEVVVMAPPEAHVRSRLEATGVGFIPEPNLVPDLMDGRPDLAAVRRIGAVLRRGGFDVVHAHSVKAGILARTVAPLSRTPSVYTPNSLDYRFLPLFPDAPRRRRRYLKSVWTERVLGHVGQAVIAVSEEERRGVLEDRLAPPDRVHLVHNGVEVDLSVPPHPELAEFRGEGPLLGIVAHLRFQKGLPDLLNGLELLAQEGRPVRFAIVGNGPLDAEVRQRVAAGPLADTTLVLPFEGRMEPYLRVLDGFVLSSLFEGLPLAVLEAMAAGLPVVATAAGGTADAVRDGETGFLVPLRDARSLADAIGRVAAGGELRQRFGDAGRALFEAKFSAAGMVERTLAVYEAVTAARVA